jgi:hypothetical protein
VNETAYPVRGILQGFKEGSFTLDESEELINGFINAAMEKGYSHGVIDELHRGKICVERDEKGNSSHVNELLVGKEG